MRGAKELWATKAPAWVKFFYWLTLHSRLWTTDRRKRHGLQDEDACALCGQEPETCDHLFTGCVLTRQLWAQLLLPLGLAAMVPAQLEDVGSWWLRQRKLFDSSIRPAFDSLVLLVAWIVWKEGNNRTFSRQASSLRQLLLKLLQEVDDWVLASFKTLSAACPVWSQHLANM